MMTRRNFPETGAAAGARPLMPLRAGAVSGHQALPVRAFEVDRDEELSHAASRLMAWLAVV
jgi:hypothetical protein